MSAQQFNSICSVPLRRLSMATRGAYFIAGFTIAAWAPFIPYVKANSGLNEGSLGMLLLCLGLGSVIVMPLTGMLTNRFGCRAVIIVLAFLGCITLPLLIILNLPLYLGSTLLFFGAAAGGMDVAAAIQAMMVQKQTGRQIMPTMLAFYSIGCIFGPVCVSLLLSLDLQPITVALCVSGLILLVLALCQRNLAPRQSSPGQENARRALPKGAVLVLGCMCFTIFLVEGAILDWGALFLVDYKNFDQAFSGIGFAVFSAAIAIGRILGVWFISLVGSEKRMVLVGCIFSFCAFLLTLFVLPGKFALLGFCLIGFGNANVIPLLFSATGKQTTMPTAAAISTVSTLGYAGVLIGPAFIGFLAHFTSLFFAFTVLGAMMLLVALLSRLVLPDDV